MPTEKGSVNFGSSRTISKSMWIDFPTIFFKTPTVSASAKGQIRYPDQFNVIINRVDPDGFDCTVKRYDQKLGWDQDLSLQWEATGDEVPEATGSQNIGSSSENKKVVKVNFPKVFAKRTPVVAWVKGDYCDGQIPDRYRLEITHQNNDGFQCIVQRMDSNSGWGQDLTLFWHSVKVSQ
ncbi:unnamed protein product [Clavelina lepadiformis]|uniref:Uncharacterized protein n=1 Tax=Clavelina lepadiformis TaxID=159417 RepID=A0ABP0GV86_CLALP